VDGDPPDGFLFEADADDEEAEEKAAAESIEAAGNELRIADWADEEEEATAAEGDVALLPKWEAAPKCCGSAENILMNRQVGVNLRIRGKFGKGLTGNWVKGGKIM
jgi:hypothetical protein